MTGLVDEFFSKMRDLDGDCTRRLQREPVTHIGLDTQLFSSGQRELTTEDLEYFYNNDEGVIGIDGQRVAELVLYPSLRPPRQC